MNTASAKGCAGEKARSVPGNKGYLSEAKALSGMEWQRYEARRNRFPVFCPSLFSLMHVAFPKDRTSGEVACGSMVEESSIFWSLWC